MGQSNERIATSARWLGIHLLSFLLANLTQLAAQETKDSIDLNDPKNIDVKSLTELRVKLVGENGEPVNGAAVMPYAMRMVEHSGHGYWNRDKLGAPKDYFSDESGMATIRYPAKVFALPEPMTTRLVTFQIQHSDYVREVVHLDLGPDLEDPLRETEVSLKKGCELQLSAIDEQGIPIEDFGVVMAGPYEPAYWADADEGGKRTSSLNDGTWQTMLVKPPSEDEPILFSGLLPLRVRPQQALKIRNVKLTAGARLEGQLADDVPRPIRGGYVMTATLPKPDGDSWDENAPSLVWYEWAEIQEDGSFVLASIPRSGQVQIIATCDGWVSKTTIAEAGSSVMGQLFEIEDPITNVEVEMEPTGTLELTVLDPEGEALQKGSVSSWPNQKYYKGGSTFLGIRFRSLLSVQNQLLSAEERKSVGREGESSIPFLECPIEDGLAIIRGLPLNRSESLFLDHDEYRFDGGINEYPRVTLPTEETVKMTLTAVSHQQMKADEMIEEAARALQNITDAANKLLGR